MFYENNSTSDILIIFSTDESQNFYKNFFPESPSTIVENLQDIFVFSVYCSAFKRGQMFSIMTRFYAAA